VNYNQSIAAIDWEESYYARAIRMATALALFLTMLAFLVLPKEFVVQPYQLKRSVEMIMEALPPQLEQMAEQPKAVVQTAVPVAAASEAEVTAQTIDATTFKEVVKQTTETDIPVVPFWKVEIKPTPVNIPVPTYPDMARSAGIEGKATVEALVGTDGSVSDARILQSSGNSSLDAAAVDAAMRSRFTPAKQRDKPVRVWVSIPFRFTLQN